MTVCDFCYWVNTELLPNLTLEPGFPRKISVRTAHRWLRALGFEVITPRKGIFIDGHERPDVVADRTAFLRRMVKLCFLNLLNAPTEDSMKAIPDDIEPPTAEKRDKTVFIFHDESIFHANDDQNLKWGIKGEKMMKKKSKGAGIMVSDFVGESKKGYWNLSRFMAQMAKAVLIAEVKYPKSEGWHNAMATDALNVTNMNVKPGGAQRILRDTVYNGKQQKCTIWKEAERLPKD